LIARVRRSSEFQKFYGTIALLIVVSVAWFILDAHRQEVLREQQYEQQRQADERREAQLEEASREKAQLQAEAREAAQRKAAQEKEAQRVPDKRPPPHATPGADREPPARVASADVMTSALARSPLGGSFAPGDLGVIVATGGAVSCAPPCAIAKQFRIRPNQASQIVRHKEAQRQAEIAAHQAAAGRETAAERAAVISATDLSFNNVTLHPRLTGSSNTQDQMDGLQILSGTVTNHSEQTLRYLEFEVTLKDCAVGSGSDQCQVAAQNNINPTVDIPPNQTRAFSEILGFGGLPHLSPQRQRAFSWRIVTASSCSQENLSAHRCADDETAPR
jgi:hypothetical protein